MEYAEEVMGVIDEYGEEDEEEIDTILQQLEGFLHPKQFYIIQPIDVIIL